MPRLTAAEASRKLQESHGTRSLIITECQLLGKRPLTTALLSVGPERKSVSNSAGVAFSRRLPHIQHRCLAVESSVVSQRKLYYDLATNDCKAIIES